jgi:hypothetical protein
MFEPFIRPHLVFYSKFDMGHTEKGVLHLYQGSVVLHPASRGLEVQVLLLLWRLKQFCRSVWTFLTNSDADAAPAVLLRLLQRGGLR